MQAGRVSLFGQTLALGRCSGSQEKKPRLRRTKEERKAMVETFIKKYRSSHNGNFPSLNLTHKEVGGSFYTVREIVRDVIQENKVLGPGSLNLKALNLEDCPDSPTYLTASSDVHEKDHRNMDLSPIADMHQGEKMYGLGNHESQGIIVGDPNGVVVSQSLLDKSSDYFHQDGNLVDVECANINSGEVSGLAHDSAALYELDSSEIQSNFENNRTQTADKFLLLHHSLSDTCETKSLVLNGNGHSNGIDCVTDGIDGSADSSDFSHTNEIDVLPEGMASLNRNISTELTDGSLSYSTFATSATKNCNSHLSSLETENFCTSQDVQQVQQTANELEVRSTTVNQNTESTVALSSSSVDEKEKEKEPPSLMPEVFVSPPSGELKTEALVEVQPNGTENIIMDGQNKCDKSIDSTSKEVCGAEGKVELECDSSNTTMSRRESSDDKEEKTEANPVWEAIKSFLNAVIRFWSE